jgi:hypothetical protein
MTKPTKPHAWPDDINDRLHAIETGMADHNRQLAIFHELNQLVTDLAARLAAAETRLAALHDHTTKAEIL